MFCCINPHSTQTCTRTCTTHSHTQLAAVCKNSLSTPLKLTDRCWTFHRLNYMDLWLSNTHTHPLKHTHTPSHTHPHTHAAGLLCGLTSPDLQTPPALSPAWNTEKNLLHLLLLISFLVPKILDMSAGLIILSFLFAVNYGKLWSGPDEMLTINLWLVIHII